ncbi:BTAD domain-containing putative transcriptional regulator [Nocardiopsis tropica]|uniref:AfsR/SARP family transcriptional regulator n=1 Tax=Nocardiopsis tropica TaxID=109330 RepID=UPI00337138C6
MTVEISVLGDIEMRIDGRPVDLGHMRRQFVFVGLLVDAGRLVTVDQLIDRVWGPRPPDGARSSLYSYVSRLRSALGAVDGITVDRRPGGYILKLDDDANSVIDLYRFREIVARARNSANGESALALFEEALRLWRADAFGSLDSTWVNELRERLRLERFRTELDRNDLLLRHGRQSELLGDLSDLAQRHPLDERLVGQLMLTLYREGRAAQALEHYERIRRMLSEAMGTDPGAELRELHRKILHADPALDAHDVSEASAPDPGARPAPAPPPLPMQLPPPPPLLAGRRREMAFLDDTQAPGALPVTVVCGLGGVGKTSLALRWAHDNLDRFPDGQLYVNLHGFAPSAPATKPQTAVHDFLTALGVDQQAVPSSAEARFGLYRSIVAHKRMLILLDNARDAEQVRPLIPGSASCTVVVTSRERLSGLLTTGGVRVVALDPLTSAEARQLLTARVGERRVAREPEAVDTIVAGCGRLPLALAITAAHAAGSPHLPLAELASELGEAESTLDALDTGDFDTSLRSVLDASYRALPEPAARLLGLLSAAPAQDMGVPAAAALAGLTRARTRQLLRTLGSAHLVEQPMPGRYQLHDLVRLHGRERTERDRSEEERREGLSALVDFFVRTAALGKHLLAPQEILSDAVVEPTGERARAYELTGEADALAWFTTERSLLPAVMRLAQDLGLHREVWRLAWDTHTFLRRWGDVDDFVGNRRVGLDAATRVEGPDAPTLRAMAHRGLATALIQADHRGEEPLEHLARAVAQFEESGDLLNQAHTHQIYTRFGLHIRDEEMALENAARSLELYRRVGNATWETSALNNLGWTLAQFGHYESARSHCQDALKASRDLGYKVGEAACLDSLGYIATRAGRHEEAVEHYHESLPVHRVLRDSYEEANTLSGLAKAHLALGEPGPAREAWTQALKLYREQHRTEQVLEIEERLRELR